IHHLLKRQQRPQSLKQILLFASPSVDQAERPVLFLACTSTSVERALCLRLSISLTDEPVVLIRHWEEPLNRNFLQSLLIECVLVNRQQGLLYALPEARIH